MKKPEEKPKSLCLAPFTHSFLSPTSERRLCCLSREPAQNFTQYIDTKEGSHQYNPQTLEEWWNGEHIRRVRRQMMNGEEPPECEVCNNKLLNTDVYRDYFWHMFKHRYDEVWDSTDETGRTVMPVRSWDYRFSNLCNFKCRMCGDQLSSSWEAEKKINNQYDWSDPNNSWAREPVRGKIKQWQQDRTEAEFGTAVEDKTVEEIYWVGGEPLMYEQHWRYMRRIIELEYSDRVYARYNTNLSRIVYKNDNLWDILAKFRDWQICASIDGIGERGEYIRSGLNYDQWRIHAEEASKNAQHYNQFKLDFTLTTPGLLEIENMVRLSNELGVQLLSKVTFAFTPDAIMSPMSLPRDLLDNIVDSKLKWLELNSDHKHMALIDLLVSLKNRPTFQEQWPDNYQSKLANAKRYMTHIDNIRSDGSMSQFLEDLPELQDWWEKL